MEEKFEVININNNTMTLKTNTVVCNSCNTNTGCGIGILASFFKTNKEFKYPLLKNATVGGFVTIKISAKTLYFYAFLLYILPILILFIVSYVAASLFSASELWQIILGLFGFFATIFIYKLFG